MTDEQLNHLIAFLSRSKESIFFELKHEKEEHAKAIAEKDRCLAEKGNFERQGCGLQRKTASFAVRILLSLRRYCMDRTLNYFDHFKESLFMYRKDGRYPIDNNIAESQVRPFTALRKAI